MRRTPPSQHSKSSTRSRHGFKAALPAMARAGKPAGYLYNQLVAFRDGQRHYPPMNYLVSYLPDSYLREMAEHFAKQKPSFLAQAVVNVDAATLARGQS